MLASATDDEEETVVRPGRGGNAAQERRAYWRELQRRETHSGDGEETDEIRRG